MYGAGWDLKKRGESLLILVPAARRYLGNFAIGAFSTKSTALKVESPLQFASSPPRLTASIGGSIRAFCRI
jgi:hypothetical protein